MPTRSTSVRETVSCVCSLHDRVEYDTSVYPGKRSTKYLDVPATPLRSAPTPQAASYYIAHASVRSAREQRNATHVPRRRDRRARATHCAGLERSAICSSLSSPIRPRQKGGQSGGRSLGDVRCRCEACQARSSSSTRGTSKSCSVPSLQSEQCREHWSGGGRAHRRCRGVRYEILTTHHSPYGYTRTFAAYLRVHVKG